MKNSFTASWINGRPAYWIEGIRVSRKKGYQHACNQGFSLPEQFHSWHKDSDQQNELTQLYFYQR